MCVCVCVWPVACGLKMPSEVAKPKSLRQADPLLALFTCFQVISGVSGVSVTDNSCLEGLSFGLDGIYKAQSVPRLLADAQTPYKKEVLGTYCIPNVPHETAGNVTSL